MNISIIVAVAENNVIGKNNSLIWHLPADLRFFKAKTTGHVIVMGRKTFESIGGGKPLPNRTTVIITRNPHFVAPEGVYIAHSLAEAYSQFGNEQEIFICGGAQIYKDALETAHHMYITRIHATFEGDTFFPEFQNSHWKLESTEQHESDENNAYNYSFEHYVKC